jgi:hypothetical protein
MGVEGLFPQLLELAEYETGYDEEGAIPKIMPTFVFEFLRDNNFNKCNEKDNFTINEVIYGLNWLKNN